MRKFPVPMSGSMSWCWPPFTSPEAQWYTMTYADSRELDRLHRAEGYADTPTHEQKLALIAKHGWETRRIDSIIHVAK